MLNKKFILSVLLIGTIAFFSSNNVLALNRRISGIDRYATSAAIASDGWEESIIAILVSGENFPDALVAAPLAKRCFNAPILLTETNSIPADTLNVIKQLQVTEVIIIGGTGVISSSVENQLTSLGIKTTRISGADRYETSIKVADKLSNVGEIAVVTGEDFADALSISPIAAKRNMPIILVQHNSIPDIVNEYIKLHNITKTYIIGAGSSLDESLVNELPNVERIDGQDKYQRNLNVIGKFKTEMGLNTIYITTGENFADGLSGSALASINCNPLILVGENSILQKNYLDNNSITNYNVVALGGTVPEAAITGFGSTDVDYENKKISDVANINLDDITKIVFYDHAAGNNPLTVEDKQKIKEFTGYLNNYIVKKVNPPFSSGWRIMAIFYINDKQVMDITFVDPLVINKSYYTIINGDIHNEFQRVEKFLNSIDPYYGISQ